ncbi:hypothetical protein FRB99_000862, partial [Tulasnella sp. 403]
AIPAFSNPATQPLAGTHEYLPLQRRQDVPAQGFYDPRTNGGSMLTKVPNTFPDGLGEPINVIISGQSDVSVLQDRMEQGGLQNYFQSLSFGISCGGGINLGDKQSANLGDGRGYVNETVVMRYNYGDPVRGTCNETILGGNHFRYWPQTGANANSSAIFLAVSYELPLAQNHDIIPNGYNLGRDWLVGNATQSTFASPNPLSNAASNSTTISALPNQYVGTTSSGGYVYQTIATYNTGLLGVTNDSVNHFQTVGSKNQPALDGLVAVLVVSIKTRAPDSGNSQTTSHNAAPSSVSLSASSLGISILLVAISLLSF